MQWMVVKLGVGMNEWVETAIGEQATLQRGIDIKKAKLKDPEHICASNFSRLRERIRHFRSGFKKPAKYGVLRFNWPPCAGNPECPKRIWLKR
jgi:hypothetical protein